MDLTRSGERSSSPRLSAALVAACSSGGSAAPRRPGSAAQLPPRVPPRRRRPSVARGGHTGVPRRQNPGEPAVAQAFATAYTAKHPNVTIDIETRPGGTEGDNLVKTRLATGEMTDIFWYNSGSLLQALNPPRRSSTSPASHSSPTSTSRSSRPCRRATRSSACRAGPRWAAGSSTTRRSSPTTGLTVPKTWAEFEANNEKLKAAGIAPVGGDIQADTWTSQLFVLADYYNVQAAVPDFADQYTNNKIKYATTPRRNRRLRAPAGGVRQGLVAEGLRFGEVDHGLKMLARARSRNTRC